jgi:hypothetical protein
MLQKVAVLSALAGLVILLAVGLGPNTGSGAFAAQDATPTRVPLVEPVMGEFDPASIAGIDLFDYPILPDISEQARLIYLDGLAQGTNPHTFAKVGDCMTEDPAFLYPIGEGDYDLGEYEALKAVIAQFTAGEVNSFGQTSQSAAGGFNAASILDSLWANPEFCETGETPLSCEFRRLDQPSIAVIMFGTNDVSYLDEAQFDFFLRSVIIETIRSGTLPLLSTFPYRPEFPDKVALFNQIIVTVAQDYDIPLINLWRALDPLPDHGVDPDNSTHLTSPADVSAAHFTEDTLQTGFAVRNLLTLQALNAIIETAGDD